MKKYLTLLWLVQSPMMNSAFGQSFTYHSNAPFGIETIRNDSTNNAQKIMFADYDEDGDLDLFLTGISVIEDFDNWEGIHYFIDMQENIGDKWHPQFAGRTQVENFPIPLGYFFPSSGDLNNDGRTDFVISAEVNYFGNRTLTYVRNTGRSLLPEYEVIRFDSLGMDDFVPESFFVPELVDLDNDGDLDLLMSGFDPAFAEEEGDDIPIYYYARNVSTRAAEPVFQGWYVNPYGLMPNPFVELLTGGDVDNDGDMDLLGTTSVIPDDSLNYLYVHLNTPGINEKPLFNTTLESPFGLPTSFGENQFLFPNLVDIDGDGDLDLFVFHGTSDELVLQYYENSLCSGTITEMSINLCEGDIVDVGGQIITDAGIYTISLPTSNGCDSTIILTVDILPLSNTIFIESICEGEIFVIGNDTFSDSGDYIVYIVADNGCDSIILLSLTVQDVDNTVTNDDNLLTAVQSGATYQWFNCDSGEDIPGATAQSFTVVSTGNYGVIITDQFGCSSVSECTFVLITGIVENNLSNEITIYPNPAESNFFILNNSQFSVSTIMLANLHGQKIVEYIPDGNSPIDISSLARGIYFVKMKVNGLEIIKKLIVI